MGQALYALPLREGKFLPCRSSALIWFPIEIMWVICRLTSLLSLRSCQTGCGILGILIFSVSSGSEPFMICALVKVLYWSQSLPWLPTWGVAHLLAENCWGHKLDIQRCDDTLSWATLALGSTSLLESLRCTFQVSYPWYCLHFAPSKATGSVLLRGFVWI